MLYAICYMLYAICCMLYLVSNIEYPVYAYTNTFYTHTHSTHTHSPWSLLGTEERALWAKQLGGIGGIGREESQGGLGGMGGMRGMGSALCLRSQILGRMRLALLRWKLRTHPHSTHRVLDLLLPLPNRYLYTYIFICCIHIIPIKPIYSYILCLLYLTPIHIYTYAPIHLLNPLSVCCIP
jgi:hypothetical protein